MPVQPSSDVDNSFIKGVITEATGLNFPENACTSASNCTFKITGDIVRREGINEEVNGTSHTFNRGGQAVSSYVWTNAGGDGNTNISVQQVGSVISFYNISNSTTSSPLSTQYISQTDLTTFAVDGAGQFWDVTHECTYSDGNGYLFIYHPNMDTVYCTYSNGTITPNSIQIQIRDFVGVNDQLSVNTRPVNTGPEHFYNLQNQGWVSSNPWYATSGSTVQAGTGVKTWNIGSGFTITTGTVVQIRGNAAGQPYYVNMNGTVTSYSGSNLTINVTSIDGNYTVHGTVLYFSSWYFTPTSIGYINTWVSAEGNYPSNADVWWYFKNSSGVYDPVNTAGNTTLSSGNAPRGHYILNAFLQNRNSISGQQGLTTVQTSNRSTNGTWFAGRVWYTGINASQPASSNTNFYTWTENIYFSQVVEQPSDFGLCYQTNDPTSDKLFDELPTDGGVIVIQGSGNIYKLFPIQNGMLVFAANGVWFITGSQGIGFSANDYTITKISNVRSISSTSYVNVLGLPYFWNEEGIYQVIPTQSGALSVEPITVNTIKTLYNNIPLSSRRYARGDYDPINYVIQWVYRSIDETSITERYTYDSILNYNTFNKAFYPYSVDISNNSINGINYISYPYISINGNTPLPGFKYISSNFTTQWNLTFSDEHDTTYVDWGNINYISTFTTGYKLNGTFPWLRKYQTPLKLQIPYVYVYSRTNGEYIAYYVQGRWDYASVGNSGRWTTQEFVEINDSNYGMKIKRHKIRGRGFVIQLNFTSVDGKPFDFMGWAIRENVNTGD